MKKKPLILVTNDDGISAPGIRELIRIMRVIGDVVVVAPDGPQSAKGQAITIGSPLYLKQLQSIDTGLLEYTCSGTPADCVKIGIKEVLKRKPDLCVSGINHGSNSAINVVYSGTMGAAIEGGVKGVPSIGFSLLDYSWDADFSALSPYVKTIATNVLSNGLPDGVVLNVNFPKRSDTPYQGIKVARQARSNWNEQFEKRVSPMGKEYYWLAGAFENLDQGNDTDEAALEDNFVSIVPVQVDLTAHQFINTLNTWNFKDE